MHAERTCRRWARQQLTYCIIACGQRERERGHDDRACGWHASLQSTHSLRRCKGMQTRVTGRKGSACEGSAGNGLRPRPLFDSRTALIQDVAHEREETSRWCMPVQRACRPCVQATAFSRLTACVNARGCRQARENGRQFKAYWGKKARVMYLFRLTDCINFENAAREGT